ncbi:MAG: hypothetical protein HN384_04855 [Nitrosopumilus sp.]|jgi:hypothetical protein|nr:hypothetical protein [Nitrosopumilus sp.]MBT3861837.1 hypothetical protein [Nitrosopumilus sp.]MBT4298893.1 hypothetical protein [Nitrosopumilus sp.]MBT6195300.1 hypothetical protein [Nitrosopumilus sp.]MBT7920390.1 hypothetical protein [Nitrosopumilus sp.]
MTVEAQYDKFISGLNQTMNNVDSDLLVKIMYLERKLPDIAPKVELNIKYKSHVDTERKKEIIRSKLGFPNQTTNHGVNVVGRMDTNMVEKFSQDPDVQYITGSATPSSY